MKAFDDDQCRNIVSVTRDILNGKLCFAMRLRPLTRMVPRTPSGCSLALCVVVVLLMQPVVVGAETDDDTASDNEQSAIVWLLNDLGDVLSRVSKAISETAQEDSQATPPEQSLASSETAGTPATSAEDAEQRNRPKANPIAAIFHDLANLFSKSETEVVDRETPAFEENSRNENVANKNLQSIEFDEEVEKPLAVEAEIDMDPAANARRNPISWLLSDIGGLLSPSASDSPQTLDDPVLTIEEAAPPQIEPKEPASETNIGSNDAIPAEIVSVDSSATASNNPVTEIFSGLAAFFQPAPKGTETKLAEAQKKPVGSGLPDDIAAGSTNVAQEGDASPYPLGASNVVSDDDVEVGPWTKAATDHIFDPSKSVVTQLESHVPETVQIDVSDQATDPLPQETVAEPAPLRTKQDPIFEARNHRALGREIGREEASPREESIIANFMDAMFGEPESIEEQSETVAKAVPNRIIPEERLDLGNGTLPSATGATSAQSVKIGDGVLSDIDLYMGRDLVIGAQFDRQDFDAEACIDRPVHASVFCLSPLDWPAEIADKFTRDTAFFNADEAVVRYENGIVSRVYTVFDAADFTDVVKFMQRRFGPPLERDIVWMNVMEAPALPNTTFRWKAITPDRRDIIVLEVRNYDDVRRSFANTEHGMVRLFREGSRPIFKHLTTMDLMLMQRRRVSRAPVDIDQPPPQR